MGTYPSLGKDEKIGVKCINARAEAVATSPSFRGAYKLGRRCLVPASGFFEKPRPEGKRPFYFTSAYGSLLAFAGLWDKWRKPDGTELLSYTIVTTAPNDFVARFHDRCGARREPLPPVARGDDPRELLTAPHNEALINFLVSSKVNSVRNDDASLVVPLEAHNY